MSTKPDLVILYNDPISKMPSRLLYFLGQGQEPHKLTTEQHGLDGLGTERWAPPGGTHLVGWAILAYVLRHVATGKITPTQDGDLTKIDARETIIPGPTPG